MRRLPLIVFGCVVLGILLSQNSFSEQWWERGQSDWYYKDDWNALYLTGSRIYRKTIELPSTVKAGYAYVWSSGDYTFRINGKEIGKDIDPGTIEDYDIKPFLAEGNNEIEILSSGETIAELRIILSTGEELIFGTDASWGGKRTKTSKVRTKGPRGYGGDTHMARILTVTTEQKAKAYINNLNVTRRRILQRDRYLFWKYRDPREVLTLPKPTEPRRMWAEIVKLLEEAREPIEEAAELLKSGKFDKVYKAAEPAERKTRTAGRLLGELMVRLERRRAERMRALGAEKEGEFRTFNRSKWNRLGWVPSTEPLDNDPAYWEFDITVPEANSIPLAGMWKFNIDPDNRGLSEDWYTAEFDDSNWKSIYAPTKWGWERWGYTTENLSVKDINKPYNGLAWYRKSLFIPQSWKGRTLVLRLGVRWGNTDWLAVNGEFLNDPRKEGSNAGVFEIPPEVVRFGEVNTLALRVFNSQNIGGIINPGLRLSVRSGEPHIRRSICGVGSVREILFDRTRLIIYSSALSPAVVLASSGSKVLLGGWHARGYTSPSKITYASAKLVKSVEFKGGLDPTELAENWLLVEGDGQRSSRPLLIVLEKRPASIEALNGGERDWFLQLTFKEPGARVVLLRFLERPDAERCRLWSQALLAYPIGYLERLRFDGHLVRVQMTYEYLTLVDGWKTEALELAPLPMLFSYALEHHWTDAKVEGGAVDLGLRAQSSYYPGSECGSYRVIIGRSQVSYSFDQMEPRVHYKGVGTFGEEFRIGEPMFARLSRWGFNSTRPQIYFGWKFFDNEKRLNLLSNMFAYTRWYGLMVFLNYFGLEGRRFTAENREDLIEFWEEMAEFCKDFPERAVCYDLINEPAGCYGGMPPSKNVWEDYNNLVKETTRAIREVDSTHPISVEAGGGWAQPEDLDMTEPTGDWNTYYQFHFYGPHTGDCHRWDLWYPRYDLAVERFQSYEGWEERMLSPIRFQIRNRAQVFHGEFGISFLGPGDSPRKWLEDVLSIHEKYRIHWSWWNYSGREIHRTGLVAGDRLNPLLSTLTEYARMKPPWKEAQ